MQVLALLLGEVAQKLTDAGVGRLVGGLFVEAPRFELHRLGLLAHRRQAERPHQPDRCARHKPLDIVAANERNVLAELLPVKLQQPMPMPVLLHAHFGKLVGNGGGVGPQSFREVGVDACVLFFERNRQCQNLALAQALESSHGNQCASGSCLAIVARFEDYAAFDKRHLVTGGIVGDLVHDRAHQRDATTEALIGVRER